jgi:hypothetical protein
MRDRWRTGQPEPEDFQPTGWLHAIDDKGNHHRLTQNEWREWSKVTTYMHWRCITPPIISQEEPAQAESKT